MQHKSMILVFAFIFLSSNFAYSDNYPYQYVYEETPENVKGRFFDERPGGKIFYYGTDRFGRYLVCQQEPIGHRRFLALYEDQEGELWQSLLDLENKKDIPFIYIKDPETGDHESWHPEELQNKHLIPKENICKPPKDMPTLNNNDFKILDVQFGFNQSQQDSSVKNQNHTHSSGNDNDMHNNEYKAPTTEVPTFSNGFNWQPYLISGCFATTLMISYYYALTYALECCRYLAQEDTWASWKSEESFETLLMTQPKYLVDNLIKDIRIKYYQEPDPIKLFLQDIAEEYDTLGKWIQFRDTLRRFYLPLGKAFYTMENRLSLLNHMRKIINYWRSQQLSIEPS